MLIARIGATGFTPPSPQPCHACHGYRVTNAHPEEVKVITAGHVSPLPSGAAAIAPPAGAHGVVMLMEFVMELAQAGRCMSEGAKQETQGHRS
jgi:hypothetical protein